MNETSKRILLAVDGTAGSMATVRYVSEALRAARVEICIYHVISRVPEVFWDLGNDPGWSEQIEVIRDYQRKQETAAADFVENAGQILIDAGRKPESVSTRIETKNEGIARDILTEARRGGYDVLILGRGQIASQPNMPLGGIASKIIGAFPTPSLWLVGGKASSDRILVALDSSPHSLGAVRHAGRLLGRGGNSITLFHAIRGIAVSGTGMEEIFPEAYRKRLQEDAERDIRAVFQSAEEILTKDFDIPPSRITTKVATSVKSRAEAVINEAVEGGCGTIVVGRRGHSEVADFSMGRVTNKLIQLARSQCLCIAG